MYHALRRVVVMLLLAFSVSGAVRAWGQGVTVLQSSTSRKLVFLMIDATDHLTGKTGLTCAVTLSKNGAAFAAAAGSVAEVGNGWYALTPTSADTGTLGDLALHATATGADPTDREVNIVAFNPDDVQALGLTALSRLFGILTSTPAFSSGAFVNFPNVTIGGYAAGQDPVTLLQAMVVDGSLTFKQLNAIQSAIALDGDRTFNATTHVAVLIYYRRTAGTTSPDKTKPVLTKTTTYDSSNSQVVSQTIVLSNLP